MANMTVPALLPRHLTGDDSLATERDPRGRKRGPAYVAFGAAALAPLGFVAQRLLWRQELLFTAAGTAGFVCALLGVGLLLRFPSIIKNKLPAGEPSTMRVMSLLIVFTFSVLMLRAGWNDHGLPSLQEQGNWIWLVTAALGGKAVQAYVELNRPAPTTTTATAAPTTTTPAPTALPAAH
ncbi:MAG TPA: hypothetical protein VH062_33615 [Polyangiaceae bacterium]|jgi:hypothetical protein|nr:hypothetical protein [Polyangiaceae bacterium]